MASKYQFTHVADALARIAIQNALFFGRAKASDLVIPWCTYTEPEVAHVGLTAEEAAEREVDTLTIPLSDVDRSKLEGADAGFLRVYLKKGGDTILGATLVGEHAGDMIGELCLAITHGIGLGKIASVIHPYPTQGEVVKKAADTWRRGKLTPFVQKTLPAPVRRARPPGDLADRADTWRISATRSRCILQESTRAPLTAMPREHSLMHTYQ